MKVLVLSTSLNPNSRSRAMAREAMEHIQSMGAECDFVDLQEFPLPAAGSPQGWSDAGAKQLAERIAAADAIIMSVPVYNYDVNAAAKNLIELTGASWGGKVVGFICAAGGFGSYMSVMSLANSLMLDFRCFILPRFVYAIKDAWDGPNLKDGNVRERIKELSSEAVRVGSALKR